MVSRPTCTAVSASISTPVRAVHSTVARHSTREPSRSSVNSTLTEVSATGWQSGTSSEVFFAAWIAAMRATPSTSPFLAVPDATISSVAGSMRMKPDAVAVRWLSGLPPTSTMRAAPRSSKWVSFSVIIHHSSMVRTLIFALAASLAVNPCPAQGLPDLGDASAATLSEQQEKTIGNRIMREVRVDKDFVEDPEIADYINALGQRLLAGADGPRREIDFFVVRDETIN